MKILRNNFDNQTTINLNQDFKSDLGWEDNAKDLERETLEKIINPAINYDTVRYVHKPYTKTVSGVTFEQTDIWFYFYFLSGSTYVQDYEPTGLTAVENAKALKYVNTSFFRLEFFKTPNNEPPSRFNRRLTFSKNLTIPLGEKFFFTTLNDLIYKPVFIGSNYRNKENMYLFWFVDDSALEDINLTGDVFYVTAKFYNAEDGSVVDFVKTDLGDEQIIEENDMYYKMVIDKNDFSYQIFKYNNGQQGDRIGLSGDPIKFYEKKN
jgi:hypothetical protein